MTDHLKALLERVEKATEPDREIDYEIAALGRAGAMLLDHNYRRLPGDDGWISSTPVIAGAERIGAARPYTDSIDDSLYVVEDLLPGWCFKLVQEKGRWTFVLRHAPELADVAPAWVNSGATAPLAILSALLSALIAKDAQQ